MRFEDTKLKDNIKRALLEINFNELTEIQEKSIEPILNGKDIIAMANTGAGKTAAFMLPLLNKINIENKNTQVLIVTPTRELAIQIVQEIRRFCKYLHGINSIAIYGGQDIRMQAITLRKGVKIVVGTPGRIVDLLNKKVLKIKNLKSLVLDEADEMLSMGFEKEINRIFESVGYNVQKLLFSATINDRVKNISNKIQREPLYIESKQNNTLLVDSIKQIAIDVKEKMKDECTLRILTKEKASNSIIFCNTKKRTELLAEFLKKYKIKLEVLNSDIRQEEREKILKELKNGQLDTIVVTDVLARGIDIKDLELVINYDIPLDNEYYVHRIGRTARQRKSGIAYTFYTGKQIERIKELEKYTNSKVEYEDVPLKQHEDIRDIKLPLTKSGLYVITLDVGKNKGIKAKDIVGAFGALSGIKSDKIGTIQVNEDSTSVEIPKEYINEIVETFSQAKIKNIDVHIIK